MKIYGMETIRILWICGPARVLRCVLARDLVLAGFGVDLPSKIGWDEDRFWLESTSRTGLYLIFMIKKYTPIFRAIQSPPRVPATPPPFPKMKKICLKSDFISFKTNGQYAEPRTA